MDGRGTTVRDEVAASGRPSQEGLPAPAARRLPRARWLDPRLLVGVLLVLVSVVVGARVVAASDRTSGVWAAAHDLAAGTPLSPDDLVRVDVVLPKDAGYLPVSRPVAGQVLARPVGAGELVPAAALADAPTNLRRLAVEVDRASVTGLSAGSAVDLDVVPARAAGQPQAPTREVLSGVPVLGVSTDAGGLGGSRRTAVVVLSVGPADARAVLDAQAAGDLRLVQVPLGAASVPGGSKGSTDGKGSGTR